MRSRYIMYTYVKGIIPCPLWVISRHFLHPTIMSAFGGKADIDHLPEAVLVAIDIEPFVLDGEAKESVGVGHGEVSFLVLWN